MRHLHTALQCTASVARDTVYVPPRRLPKPPHAHTCRSRLPVQLSSRSTGLAHRLGAHGLPHVDNRLIGLLSERSIAAVVAIFGILKAGAAYVPLDVKYPPKLIREVIDDDARCPAVLLETEALVLRLCAGLKARLFVFGATGVLVRAVGQMPAPDGVDGEKLGEARMDPLQSSSHDLVYCMYTSGSTGKPKGVMVGHRELLMRVGWLQETFAVSMGDVVPLKTRLIFGVSEWEIFWTLSQGATLTVVGDALMHTPAAFHAALVEAGATVVCLVPSHLAALLGAMEEGLAHGTHGALRTLRHVICCGEALSLSTVKLFHRAVLSATALTLTNAKDTQSGTGTTKADCELHNLYGPTEGSMTHSRCLASDMAVSIGKPIGNTVVLLVDRDMRPVPVGAVGELVFGGCIAQGYLGNAQLSAEKFVPNTVMEHGEGGVPPAPTLFRTGDAAYRLPSGDLVFCGRIDRQCKVRGYRIELEAVESILKAFPALRSEARVACVAQGSGSDTRLVAFVEARSAAEVASCAGILDYARSRLAEHMVPSRVETLEEMPTLLSGKLDLKLLSSGHVRGTAVSSADGSSSSSGQVTDSLGTVQSVKVGQSPVDAQHEQVVLNVFRAVLMFGVTLDHWIDSDGTTAYVAMSGLSMGHGLHLGICKNTCTTPMCAVINGLLVLIGGWKTMSGFAMASGFAESAFADSTRFGRKDAVTVFLLIIWIWCLDPLMWHAAPSSFCEGVKSGDSSWEYPFENPEFYAGSLAEGTVCGPYVTSYPRWYLQFVLINKCIVVGLRWAPAAFQCFLVLLLTLLVPSINLCITESACAQATTGIENWWAQLEPWRWGVWTVLVSGPTYSDGSLIEADHTFEYLVSRRFLCLSVQYMFTYHYGRSATRWLTSKWKACTRPLRPRWCWLLRLVGVCVCLSVMACISISVENLPQSQGDPGFRTFGVVIWATEWNEDVGTYLLSHQLATLRALLGLSVVVVLLACSIALATPSRESRLIRIAGSTTLGAYMFQSYVSYWIDTRWFGWLPRLTPETASGAVPPHVVLFGTLWILLVPALWQVTVFPVAHWLLLGLCRLILWPAAALWGLGAGCVGQIRQSIWAMRAWRLVLLALAAALLTWLFVLRLPLKPRTGANGAANEQRADSDHLAVNYFAVFAFVMLLLCTACGVPRRSGPGFLV